MSEAQGMPRIKLYRYPISGINNGDPKYMRKDHSFNFGYIGLFSLQLLTGRSSTYLSTYTYVDSEVPKQAPTRVGRSLTRYLTRYLTWAGTFLSSWLGKVQYQSIYQYRYLT